MNFEYYYEEEDEVELEKQRRDKKNKKLKANETTWCEGMKERWEELIATKITENCVGLSFKRYKFGVIVEENKEEIVDKILTDNGYYNFKDEKFGGEGNGSIITINGKKYRRKCVNLNWLMKKQLLWEESLNCLIDEYVGFPECDNQKEIKTLAREDEFNCKSGNKCCSIIRTISELDKRWFCDASAFKPIVIPNNIQQIIDDEESANNDVAILPYIKHDDDDDKQLNVRSVPSGRAGGLFG